MIIETQKEDIQKNIADFSKEREVLERKHQQEIQNMIQKWENDLEYHRKEIKIKDLIHKKLNETINKLKDEIKVIKTVLKSPHLYSKLNEYALRKLDFDKIKEGIERSGSEQKKGQYKLFEKLNMSDFTDTPLRAKPQKPRKEPTQSSFSTRNQSSMHTTQDFK